MSEFAPWTSEEVALATKTKQLLLDRSDIDDVWVHSGKMELWTTIVNCKFRPEKAADNFVIWCNEMSSSFSINSFDEVHENLRNNDKSSQEWSRLSPLFTAYAGCGRDKSDRSVMYIKARPTSPEEERDAIRVGVLYWLAVHADMVSLRNGISFIIDTEGNDMSNKYGNENKLQKVYQCIPLRPQCILILGAGFVKRVLINAVISIASLFTSQKVLDRVKFGTIDDVKAVLDQGSMPVHRGGSGGGLDDNDKVVGWVKDRLLTFPQVPEY